MRHSPAGFLTCGSRSMPPNYLPHQAAAPRRRASRASGVSPSTARLDPGRDPDHQPAILAARRVSRPHAPAPRCWAPSCRRAADSRRLHRHGRTRRAAQSRLRRVGMLLAGAMDTGLDREPTLVVSVGGIPGWPLGAARSYASASASGHAVYLNHLRHHGRRSGSMPSN